MRILIADDQKSVGTTLAAMVSDCRHEVVEVVGSGLEAIQAYDKYKPDVVLMDYWMAKLNGVTACRNILAKDPTARVILVSAWSPARFERRRRDCDSFEAGRYGPPRSSAR